MVFVVALFLILFYSTLHLETAYSIQSADRGATTPFKQESFPPPHTDVYTISVSDGFRKIIPQNGAYWNRVLHSNLKRFDNKKHPFRNESQWHLCRKESQELLQLNVHDFNTYPVLLQSFLQSMNCKSPPILIDQPRRCIPSSNEWSNQIFLLFAIKSTPGNFEQRQAVRETWGREVVLKNGMRVRTVFLLGSSSPDDPKLDGLLSYEAQHFRDILQWEFQDTLFNLTLKMNTFLQWTLRRCPQVSFVFSGDDDVFVNTPALLSYLQSLDASKAAMLYVGHVINNASPLRDPRSKYYIPLSFYDGPYPAYTGGGGFLFSGTLLQSLYVAADIVPFFPIDDAYFGMCAKALGVPAEAHAKFQTFDIKEQDRGNVCIHKDYLLIHRRTPQQMIKLWRGINNPLLTCWHMMASSAAAQETCK